MKKLVSNNPDDVITRLRVNHSSLRTQIRKGTGRYDRGNTSTDHTVRGLYISTDQYGDVYIPGEVSPGDNIWLVYAVYSTGDSFGHDDKNCIDFISIHRDEETARNNAKILCKINGDEFNYDYQVPITMEGGTKLNYNPPWLGYFERLDYIDVQSFRVSVSCDGRYYPDDE